MDHQITVMTFNIWVDGVSGGQPISQTAEVIRRSGADIVGMQEVMENTRTIAEAVGFNHIHLGRDTAVMSRFEIVKATPRSTGAVLQLEDGTRCVVCSVHLAHAPYQPFQLLGVPYGDFPFLSREAEAIEAADAARAHQVADILHDLLEGAPRLPAFVTGDFNEPSHLDWTEAAARAGRHPLKVNYPTIRRLEGAGMIDSFRRMYPDEMAYPGYTWPTVEAAKERDHEDRIDFILYSGEGVKPHSATIVGGDPRYADLVVAPYPSDHRAVLAAFSLPGRA